VLLYFYYSKRKLATFNLLPIVHCIGSVHLLVMAILKVMKAFVVTRKVTSKVAEQLLRYILSVVSIAMLKCSAAIKKALKDIMRVIFYIPEVNCNISLRTVQNSC
jgi:hypothetical protein